MLLDKLDEYCPEKTRRISSDEQPWFTEQLRRLHRKKKREFRRHRGSRRYRQLQKLFEKKLIEEKVKFKRKMIDDVLEARSGQWYEKLKRMTNFANTKRLKTGIIIIMQNYLNFYFSSLPAVY